MNREIFCKNCKFYRNDPNFKYPKDKNTGSDVHTTCNCQYNIDTHYGYKDPRKYISTPSIINRAHDCTWFIKYVKLNTYLWDHDTTVPKKYKDHGEGSFNINPLDGIDGFWIGNKNLREWISEGESGDIQDLRRRVNAIEEEISCLTQIKTDIQDLKNKVQTNTQNIVTISGNVQTLSNKVNRIETKVNQVDEKVEDIYNGNVIIDGGVSKVIS